MWETPELWSSSDGICPWRVCIYVVKRSSERVEATCQSAGGWIAGLFTRGQRRESCGGVGTSNFEAYTWLLPASRLVPPSGIAQFGYRAKGSVDIGPCCAQVDSAASRCQILADPVIAGRHVLYLPRPERDRAK